MHQGLIFGLLVSGTVLYVLVMMFISRIVGFNRLPSG